MTYMLEKSWNTLFEPIPIHLPQDVIHKRQVYIYMTETSILNGKYVLSFRKLSKFI